MIDLFLFQLAKAANLVLLRFCRSCKPAVFFEAVVNNMISTGPKKEAQWGMLLKVCAGFGILRFLNFLLEMQVLMLCNAGVCFGFLFFEGDVR